MATVLLSLRNKSEVRLSANGESVSTRCFLCSEFASIHASCRRPPSHIPTSTGNVCFACLSKQVAVKLPVAVWKELLCEYQRVDEFTWTESAAAGIGSWAPFAPYAAMTAGLPRPSMHPASPAVPEDPWDTW